MTVKELKEKLNQFDDRLIVLAIDDMGGYFRILNVSQGFNEADGCLFLDGYEEDEELEC
jgi:hypothetical protein